MKCVKSSCLVLFVFILKASCSGCPNFPSDECLAAEIVGLENYLTNVIKLNSVLGHVANSHELYGFTKKDWKKMGTVLQLVPAKSPLKLHLIRVVRLALQAVLVAATSGFNNQFANEDRNAVDLVIENALLNINTKEMMSRMPRTNIDDFMKIFEPNEKKESLCQPLQLVSTETPGVLRKVETTVDVVGALAYIIFGKHSPKVEKKKIVENARKGTNVELPVEVKAELEPDSQSDEYDTSFFDSIYGPLGINKTVFSKENPADLNLSNRLKTENRLLNEDVLSNIPTRKGEISLREADLSSPINTDVGIVESSRSRAKNYSIDFRKTGEGINKDPNNLEVDILNQSETSTLNPVNEIDETGDEGNSDSKLTDSSGVTVENETVAANLTNENESKNKNTQKFRKVSGINKKVNARKSNTNSNGESYGRSKFRVKPRRRSMSNSSPIDVKVSSKVDNSDKEDAIGFRMLTDDNEDDLNSRRTNVESGSLVSKIQQDENDVPKRRIEKSDKTGYEDHDKEVLYRWFFTKFKEDDARRLLTQLGNKDELPVYDYKGERIPYRANGQTQDFN